MHVCMNGYAWQCNCNFFRSTLFHADYMCFRIDQQMRAQAFEGQTKNVIMNTKKRKHVPHKREYQFLMNTLNIKLCKIQTEDIKFKTRWKFIVPKEKNLCIQSSVVFVSEKSLIIESGLGSLSQSRYINFVPDVVRNQRDFSTVCMFSKLFYISAPKVQGYDWA